MDCNGNCLLYGQEPYEGAILLGQMPQDCTRHSGLQDSARKMSRQYLKGNGTAIPSMHNLNMVIEQCCTYAYVVSECSWATMALNCVVLQLLIKPLPRE